MLSPYDPHHPDGPVDPEDEPLPLAGVSWLDDDEPEPPPRSDFSLFTEDPE